MHLQRAGVDAVQVERIGGIERVDEVAWRALEPPNFPFFDFEFLRALERSGSIGPGSGWEPVYLVCRDEKDGGRVLGALCLYLKTDSYGEYIFDWEWARAYERHGLPYYPKLVAAVPFTPATGPKLLVRPDIGQAGRGTVTRALLYAVQSLVDELRVRSAHALFLPEGEVDDFAQQGFAVRHSLQFHWRNRGYGAFSDYQDALKSKRRGQIKRERRQLRDEGLVIEWLTGETLDEDHAATMYQFYVGTFETKWGFPYLTETFFYEVFRTMENRILLVLAREELSRRPIAGALFFFKGRSLFGRYWGAAEKRRHLHFEVCYYQGIEFAIERGLKLFEAGAQGVHKLARGFLPTLTYSAHQIHHRGFRRAIEQYIAEEKEMLAGAMAAYAKHDPYKR
jgi:predicted N-acyltransferase